MFLLGDLFYLVVSLVVLYLAILGLLMPIYVRRMSRDLEKIRETVCNQPRARPVKSCRKCGFDNREGDWKCMNCGEALLAVEPARHFAAAPVKCPKCGVDNDPDSDRCFHCGDSLGAAS